jgi:hypothetical protein
MAHRLRPVGIPRQAPTGQTAQRGVGEHGKAGCPVAVHAGEQQRTQPVDLPVRVVTISWRADSRIRNASVTPSARGISSRSASWRSANPTARCASIASDLPRPRRSLRTRCPHSITGRPARGQRARQPNPVTTRPLHRSDHPRAGRMLAQPRHQPSKPHRCYWRSRSWRSATRSGSPFSTACTSRCVSTPTTASTTVSVLLPSVLGTTGRHRPEGDHQVAHLRRVMPLRRTGC